MEPYPLAPPEVAEKCKKALDQSEEIKNQRNAVLNDIREVAAGTSQTEAGVGVSQQIVRGPMDYFASSKARQHTLNATWKKDERKEVCRKIGRFIYSSGLAFNSYNDPYFIPMYEEIANYGQGFQPPKMHELRTWILKVEVDDINKMMEEHKMTWEQ
uniref:Uncharacterized protein n=1 Tax=Antirrhinum hispanicum TaxID=49039 RepID=Q9AXB9_ANTHI|nr:hypothetical protein [Antirrhinum hispanicum]